MKRWFKIICCLLIMLFAGAGTFLGFNNFRIEFDIPDHHEITIEYGDTYTAQVPAAVWKGDRIYPLEVPLGVTCTKEGDQSRLGIYRETYQASFLWQEKTADLEVRVQDTQPPIIELVSDPEHYTIPGTPYEEEGYKAYDNHDGDLTLQVKSEEVNGNVIYTVTDGQGNKTTVTREIRYADITPPVLSLKGKTDITITVGDTFKEPGYMAEDDRDGDLTASVRREGEVNVEKAGTYTITYLVSDAFGNETKQTRTIHVKPKKVLKNNEKNPGNKVVYLTFDDGPGKYTDDLLAVLDKYNVRATFFVTNQFPSWQKEIRKEAKAGHTVAVHSYSHDFAKIYKSESAFYSDVDQMAEVIRKQTGVTPSILRFPGGTSNKVSREYCSGIMTALSKSCGDHGYRYCDWNVDSNDAGGAKTSSEVAANVIAGLKKHNVSYVLQHDIKKFSVDAVEEIITWGLENGYTFLPLTDSSPMHHHHINN